MSKKSEAFQPLKLRSLEAKAAYSDRRVTVTATLKGEVADEFMKIAEEAGLNKSQLALQMIYHALNKTEDLKDFYRRLAILAE